MLVHRLKISNRRFKPGDPLFIYSRKDEPVFFTYDVMRSALMKAASTTGMLHMRLHEIKHGVLQDL